MNGSINFGGVGEASEKRMTRPGTIDVFDITKVEFGESKEKKTPYMRVFFERKDDNFRHEFYLSPRALPRTQTLAKASTGSVLDADISMDALARLLTGKKVALKVLPKIDEEKGKVYADLGFGGFAKPAQEVEFLEFTADEQREITKALALMERSASASNETSGTGEQPPRRF